MSRYYCEACEKELYFTLDECNLKWVETAEGEDIAYYICEHCGAVLVDVENHNYVPKPIPTTK